MSSPAAPPLPPMSLRLMRDSDEEFVAGAAEQVERLVRAGLQPHHRLLDVGCSVGRTAIGLLRSGSFAGRYVGFDVTSRQVEWARANLTPVAPQYTFKLVDVRNDRYNPNGRIDRLQMQFPVRTSWFDAACLFSIFTHFYKEDIELYLRELHRALRPGGVILCTWFLFNERNRATVTGPDCAYPMTHRLDDVTLYYNADDPLHAIAFDETFVRKMIAEAGFKIVSLTHGTWAGGAGPEFQDEMVLRKPPLSVTTRIKRRLSRYARRVAKISRR
jgi:SAM-dependent methyltransferase